MLVFWFMLLDFENIKLKKVGGNLKIIIIVVVINIKLCKFYVRGNNSGLKRY